MAKKKKKLTKKQVQDLLELLLDSTVNTLLNIQKARAGAYTSSAKDRFWKVGGPLDDVARSREYQQELLDLLKKA